MSLNARQTTEIMESGFSDPLAKTTVPAEEKAFPVTVTVLTVGAFLVPEFHF